jgi:hypothetical protein
MKKIVKIGLLLALTGILFSSCAADYYVSERPVEPVYVRPVAPYAGAYWVPGEWAWRGGRYAYINGYYAHPRPGRVYMRGYWHPVRRGYAWHRGYWR